MTEVILDYDSHFSLKTHAHPMMSNHVFAAYKEGEQLPDPSDYVRALGPQLFANI